MVDAFPAPGGGEPPLIEYPRVWTYKVIGRVEDDMRAAIEVIVEGRDHTLEYSRHSTKGNFVSLQLELTVQTEADRNAIFAALTEHVAVVMVI